MGWVLRLQYVYVILQCLIFCSNEEIEHHLSQLISSGAPRSQYAVSGLHGRAEPA